MQDLHSSIATAFDSAATSDARFIRQKFYVSWLRNSGASAFGIVGSSIVNNSLVKGENSVVTPIDTYEFFDESDRALRLEYDRRIEEPLGGIGYAIMNVLLDNSDKRFTAEFDSTIGTALLPYRPSKMLMGFLVNGAIDKVMPVFKGLTDTIKESKLDRTVSFSGFDYLSYLDKLELESDMYVNQRSDQIIADILTDAGFGSSQYILDEGLNTVGYAWFEKGTTAGERLRKICEAEEGRLYQDEYGYIRFENRRKFLESPHNTVQWTFNANDILDWKVDDSVKIINKCIVIGTPRSEGELSEIWKDGIVEKLEKDEVKEIWAKFENPCISIEALVAGIDYAANEAEDGGGTDRSSNVSIALEAFAQDAKLTITNSSGVTVYLVSLRLMGTPAIITSTIQQSYQDDNSINKFDESILKIENDFIDNDSFAKYLAKAIVTKYKDPLKRVRILIRGVPHLQLLDKIQVYDRDLATYKNYRVMGIQGTYALGEFLQWLTLREITTYEADAWAIVGIAKVDKVTEFVGI